MSLELPPRPQMPWTWRRSFGDKRRRRIERELQALYAMRSHLTGKEIICAVLAIPALALLCLAAAWKLHLLSGSLPLAIGVALVCGAAIWWIGRYWFLLAALIVFALCIIALEDFPDLGGLDALDFSDDPKSKKKSGRKLKLELAISRRETLLRSLK